jgi:hypothetical protein
VSNFPPAPLAVAAGRGDKVLRSAGETAATAPADEHDTEELLEEFIEWARECGEDVFYIFEFQDEAIEKFMKEKKTFKSE